MTEQTSESPAEMPRSTGDVPTLAPISASTRIDAMDILRGIAIIGILFMNIEWYDGRSINDIGSFDRSLTGIDHAVGWLIRCLVAGKFYKLFALLFGMGFAVMLIRAREVGKPFGAWFTRRMLVLFVFGMLHMIFVWGGDILHDYAFTGMLLLGFVLLLQTERLRKYDQPNTYLRIGIIWIAFPIIAGAVAAMVFGIRFDHSQLVDRWQDDQYIARQVEERMPVTLAPEKEDDETDDEHELTKDEEIEQKVIDTVRSKQEHAADVQREIDAYSQPSYWEATRFRFDDALSRLQYTPFFALFVLMPVFLIGYWFVASGVLRNHRENVHIFKSIAIIGMSFGLLLSISGLTILQHPVIDVASVLPAVGNVTFYFGQFVLCAGYVGTIVLLLGSPAWTRRLDRFAPLGKMALTNYIMQTVVLAVIFHGYAGGLFGQVGRAPQMLVVIAIVVFQLYFSAWWLRRYRFGPLEWLWRSLTYLSIQPMRVT
jgi:uncharacterized membrane protein YeiB